MDPFGLEGQPALVVGGGYGSGRETALLLARCGARVAIGDVDPARAEAVAAEVGGVPAVGDVTTPEGAEAVVDQACRRLGGLTRLANIVGGTQATGDFLQTDTARWDADLRLNLYQQMLVSRAAGRRMVEGGGGAIVMMASAVASTSARYRAGYGMAKAGVLSLARTLAEEWGPHGVRVNCVSPDIFATDRRLNTGTLGYDEALARFDANAADEGTPLERVARAHEIAGPIVFLLSDLASYVTGHDLVIDGGTLMRFPHRLPRM